MLVKIKGATLKIFILCFFILSNILLAQTSKPKSKNERLDIKAKTFKSLDGVTTISGDVFIKKGKSTLNADLVKVFADKNRKPIKYEAIGNVKFHIFQNLREFKGNSKKLVYSVALDEYSLYDDAVVKEIGKPNTIKGDVIVLTKDGNYANVIGSKDKPANITFILGDDDEQKSESSLPASDK